MSERLHDASPPTIRLDLWDPVLPIKLSDGPRHLPLFFAFSYDASALSYRVHSENAIEILDVETTEVLPNCPYQDFPAHFKPLSIKAIPITYDMQRDLSMVSFIYSNPTIHKAIPTSEIERFRSLGYPNTRLGVVHDLLQMPRGEPCPNVECSNHLDQFCMEIFATIPECPFRGFDLWRSDGSTIQIVYEICRQCGSIRTYATYD